MFELGILRANTSSQWYLCHLEIFKKIQLDRNQTLALSGNWFVIKIELQCNHYGEFHFHGLGMHPPG